VTRFRKAGRDLFRTWYTSSLIIISIGLISFAKKQRHDRNTFQKTKHHLQRRFEFIHEIRNI